MNKLKLLIVVMCAIMLSSCGCCYYTSPTPMPYVDRCGYRYQRPSYYYYSPGYCRPYYYSPYWRR